MPFDEIMFAFGLRCDWTRWRAPSPPPNAMQDEQRQFLSLLAGPPARLTAEQTAWVLNCQPHDITTLVAARLLKPLGNPPPNGSKYFATPEILELAHDRAWLSRMTHALQQHWRTKNSRRNGILLQTRP